MDRITLMGITSATHSAWHSVRQKDQGAARQCQGGGDGVARC